MLMLENFTGLHPDAVFQVHPCHGQYRLQTLHILYLGNHVLLPSQPYLSSLLCSSFLKLSSAALSPKLSLSSAFSTVRPDPRLQSLAAVTTHLIHA